MRRAGAASGGASARREPAIVTAGAEPVGALALSEAFSEPSSGFCLHFRPRHGRQKRLIRSAATIRAVFEGGKVTAARYSTTHALVRGVFAVVALAAAIIGPTALRSAPARADSLPSFGRPVISGINGWGFEPNLRIDTHGRRYMSVPNTASSGYSFIWRSLDGGSTWKWVPAATPLTGKISTTCVGGGDTELATDSADNLYFNDLYLVNFSTARSADQGATLAPSTCAAVASSPDDRQWYAVDGDPTNPTNPGSIILAYNIAYSLLNPANANCAPANQLVFERSPIPGDVTGASAGVQFNPAYQGVTSITDLNCPEGIMGPDEVHTYNTPSGVVKRVYVPHDNAALDGMFVAYCDLTDFVTSPTGFTNCHDVPIGSRNPNTVTGGNFPVLTIDSAGNVFAVWEQAPYDRPNARILGDCVLFMSESTDMGQTWSTPAQIPTPGLHNNVYAWISAGDSGRVDASWYGTDSVQSPGTFSGPTSAEGDWGLYFAQTLDGGQHWTQPLLASEHFIHRGHIFTLLGETSPGNPLGPSLDTQRTATGDFLQMRIGLDGEANIVYTDSNHLFETLGEAAFVKQNGGSSALADPAKAMVPGAPAATGSVTDAAGDATFDANGTSSANIGNLDILAASGQVLDATHYRFKVRTADGLSLGPPANYTGGDDLVWMVSWQRPEGRDSLGNGDVNGGHHFFAYIESNNGAAPVCYDGDAQFDTVGAGALRSYPGANQITSANGTCTFTPGAQGDITIDVPIADVSPAIPIDQTLYSVTAATMTLAQPANTVPGSGGIGGVPFNLIDAAAPFDVPSGPSTSTPEGQPALIGLAAALAATGVLARRRARRRADVTA
jgi:hypothetical protein